MAAVLLAAVVIAGRLPWHYPHGEGRLPLRAHGVNERISGSLPATRRLFAGRGS